MKIIEDNETRVIDTFAARDLHKLQKRPSINSFIDFGVRTGYSLGSAQKRRGKNIEI